MHVKSKTLQEDNDQSFEDLFFHSGQSGIKAFEEMMEAVTNQLIDFQMEQTKPYNGKSPAEVKQEVEALKQASCKGDHLPHFLKELDQSVMNHSIHVNHRQAVGHLHCPPLLPGVAAELILSVFNQSMDSWDQSPAAGFVEEKMIHWLIDQFQLGEQSDGVFSSGGTQSNYMGLLLARDYYCEREFGHDVQKEGLPSHSSRLKILCSKEAHFTVKKSAAQLGLGEEAVVLIETDEDHRMCFTDLKTKVKHLKNNGDLPFALVGTCGTTDFGSIDPLKELADFSKENNLWFHVDAAYGGALILSHSHREKLKGIQEANSITVDFHKLFYQPISCGAFLINDQSCFKYLNHHADYLNPKEDEEEGIPHLVNKTVATSRRFDALKLWTSLRVVGIERFQKMIDHTFVIAQQAADEIEAVKELEGVNRNPELNTVLFRFTAEEISKSELNQMNRVIQQKLLYEGAAFAAKTKVNNDVYLKLTLLNPRTSLSDIKAIFKRIIELGIQEVDKRRVLI
ncbi:aspartate aminotransferase family protein [Halobacillus sp. A5]|uniref:pyridoxal phosphate-dependent decarboxylase family protein n=1 Tax=Halobacillus sp. A5 TaxID=2880263 RepID=UPI0020A652B4|nr:aspartate aminotransferase family protein [Halobacillus sp. A5]MCP3028202.1 aspartate aminotransferase family protein [Halobacillus sp. A5]